MKEIPDQPCSRQISSEWGALIRAWSARSLRCSQRMRQTMVRARVFQRTLIVGIEFVPLPNERPRCSAFAFYDRLRRNRAELSGSERAVGIERPNPSRNITSEGAVAQSSRGLMRRAASGFFARPAGSFAKRLASIARVSRHVSDGVPIYLAEAAHIGVGERSSA